MKIPVEFVQMPTARCDRACKHCFSCSTQEGNTLSPKIRKGWVKRVSKFDWPKRVYNTGFGEPCLDAWLPDIAERLLAAGDEELLSVTTLTSGCLSEDDSGYRVLSELAEIKDSRNKIHLSYSTYNSTFPDRLRFTLPLLSKTGRETKIVFTWDDNDQVSPKELHNLLRQLGYELKLCIHSRGVSKDLELALRIAPEDWEQGKEAYGLYLSYFGLLRYANEDGHQVTVRSQSLGKEGRAQSGKLRNDGMMGICCHIKNVQELYINSDGIYLPCPARHHEEVLSMGRIDRTDIDEAIGRQRAIQRACLERWLTFPRLSEDRCEHCFWVKKPKKLLHLDEQEAKGGGA